MLATIKRPFFGKWISREAVCVAIASSVAVLNAHSEAQHASAGISTGEAALGLTMTSQQSAIGCTHSEKAAGPSVDASELLLGDWRSALLPR